MDQKEIRKLTRERLSSIRIISGKLNQYKRKLEEARKLEKDKECISKLQSKVLEYETELINIKNAIESLEDREKQVIVLTAFEKVSLDSIAYKINLSRSQVYRIKAKALDTIGEILYC
ncbi:sigma factor-like helix-turn-helix DNA-binding protein [uncultured Clostridium sp.]|uniref:sigma factor-like helix-turn-helix DNA-binding protein n=1 Tax=uncultured Clostridium sp. TaxID=59620 RepID=UPI0028ECEFF8|nr:sigma factor-like helix-turn-helix DNA-binding protein [uncultured Clostridium sp.]